MVVMLLSVIPFFFIPSLVRNSMSALGNLGAKITMAGRRLSSGSTRALRGTDAYREGQNRLAERNALRRATRLESGHGVRSWASRRLRNAGFTGASQRIDNSLERSRNRLIARQRKLALDDVNAGVHLDALTGEARENAVAAARHKHEMGLVDDAENAYITNDSFNHNDLDEVSNEFSSVMNDLALDSGNTILQARARALSRMLMSKGPNGQDKLMKILKDRAYAGGNSSGARDAAGRTVMSFLANDNKISSQMKEGNYGDWKFMNHYASNDAQSLASRSDYEIMAAGNVSAQALTKGTDDFYKNFLRQAGVELDGNGHIKRDASGNIKFNPAQSQFVGNGREGDILKIAKEAKAVFDDERLANATKSEVKDWLRGIIDANNAVANASGQPRNII